MSFMVVCGGWVMVGWWSVGHLVFRLLHLFRNGVMIHVQAVPTSRLYEVWGGMQSHFRVKPNFSCHNPNYNVNQPNFTSTDVWLNTNMTWHTTTTTIKLKSTRKGCRSGLKFCMQPYLTIPTTTKHNLTLPSSGGGGIYLPSWNNSITTSRTI